MLFVCSYYCLVRSNFEVKIFHPSWLSCVDLLTGNTVIDWLVSEGKARNRAEGLMLATGLLTEGFLQAAGDISKDAAEKGADCAFVDQIDALYYFVS